jgi:hypothetical protein
MTGHHELPRLPIPWSNTSGGFPGAGNSVIAIEVPFVLMACSREAAAGVLVTSSSFLLTITLQNDSPDHPKGWER